VVVRGRIRHQTWVMDLCSYNLTMLNFEEFWLHFEWN